MAGEKKPENERVDKKAQKHEQSSVGQRAEKARRYTKDRMRPAPRFVMSVVPLGSDRARARQRGQAV